MIEVIPYKDFIELVKQMRHNQKRFQNFKKPEIEKTKQNIENQVDEIIAKSTDSQLSIF